MAHVDSELDRNHSHFILVTKDDKHGLRQTKLRSDFEACMGQNSAWQRMQTYIERLMREQVYPQPQPRNPKPTNLNPKP
jgi:hypothetical protein